MKTDYTDKQLAAMDSTQLVALYNQLTGKAIKKFSTRAAGLAQVRKQLDAQRLANLKEHLTGEKHEVVAEQPAKAKAAAGRKPDYTTVELNKNGGNSRVQTNSMRGQIIAYLQANNGKATAEEIAEKVINGDARGYLKKLAEVGWVVLK